MVAVDSNTPWLISVTDMDARASLLVVQLFRNVRRAPASTWMRLRSSIEAAGSSADCSDPAATTEDRPTQVRLVAGTCPVVTGRSGAHGLRGPHRCPGGPGTVTLYVTSPAAVSATQTQALDERAVRRHIDLGEVLQQPAPPADQQQQAAPGVVVVLVGLEVLGEVDDPLGEQRDLRLRRAGVGLVQPI